MKILIAVCIGVTLAVLIGSVTILLCYRKNTKRMMQELLNRIDEAIAGNYSAEKYDEGMLSAIEERLNQLLTISKETKQNTINEKNTIQSLISDISHQIKIPLSNILLYAQLLQESSKMQEEAKTMVNQIQSQADKLDFLLQALVKTSYLEPELISLTRKQEQVDRLILSACQEVEMSAMAKHITIEFEECELICSFDFKWTMEAISNILENAIKYSSEDTHVLIRAVSYESFVRIDIKDEGIGIAEEEQGLIFARFYRSAQVSGEKGLGIGLYLVREIITKQGGYIKLSSKRKEGSTFSVFLPFCHF